MAVTLVALHCARASDRVRRWPDRSTHSYLAGGRLENGLPCPRETARLFEVRAHPRSQGGGQSAARVGAVSARVLSWGTDAVHTGGAETRPSVSPSDLAQT